MNEFRRAKRRQAATVVQVVDCMTEQVIGRIGNLSETGMLMIANNSGRDDALYQLRFQLVDNHGRAFTIDVGAHQLWSDLTMPPSTYWTGYRFIDLGPDDAEHLRTWVEQPGATYA